MHNSTHTIFSAAANHFFDFDKNFENFNDCDRHTVCTKHFTFRHLQPYYMLTEFYFIFLRILYLCYSDFICWYFFCNWLYFNIMIVLIVVTHVQTYGFPLRLSSPSPFLPSLSIRSEVGPLSYKKIWDVQTPQGQKLGVPSSSRMRVIYHNWSATKQRPHPQSVAEMSRHSVLSGDRIRQCETSSGSRHKDTDQCL